ncbi:MAG: alpha/beta hydrolase [Planctomycetota bacterium]
MDEPGPINESRPARLRRLLRTAVLTLVVGYPLLVLVACQIHSSVVFPAGVAGDHADVSPHAAAEVVAIETEAGEVAGWFVPAAGVSAGSPGPAVVFFHGNAERADAQGPIVQVYRSMGVSVLLAEYRGYAGRPGRMNEAAATADTPRWFDLLAARDDVDAERIVVHGRSIGGAVAGRLLGQCEPTAVVVESTPLSVSAMAWRFGLPGPLLPNRFRTDLALAAYGGPTLIMHGRDDDLIPFSHGQRLAELAGGDVVFVAFDAKHNDMPRSQEHGRYVEAIRATLIDAGVIDGGAD